MRSALAHALSAEGLDDRTIIRTIALWRATQPIKIMHLVYGLCANKPGFKPPIEQWGICS